MQVDRIDKKARILIISSDVVRVEITRRPHEGCYIAWEIWHNPHERVAGNVILMPHEMRAAFGLSDKPGKYGGELIRRYGADSAERGKYIRRGSSLNIPCPGTGDDGDPNVSIFLSDEIRDAVRKFLK